jgi:hypothetical protein
MEIVTCLPDQAVPVQKAMIGTKIPLECNLLKESFQKEIETKKTIKLTPSENVM